jgi:hypothetical protein
MADIVRPDDDTSKAPDLVAIRAAEIARASLELPDTEPEPPPPAPTPSPRPPPTWKTTTPGADVVPPARLRAPAPAPRTPLLVLGTGLSALMGADATAPGLDLDVELRIIRYFALAAHTDIPLVSTSVTGPDTTVKISPGVFGIGPIFPLADTDSFVVPRLGAGTGFVWLHSVADGRSIIQPGNSQPSTTTIANTDTIYSPIVYGDAAVSLRVVGNFRLTLDALIGTTAHRMVVRDEGTHIAYWGQPFGRVAMRMEMMLR